MSSDLARFLKEKLEKLEMQYEGGKTISQSTFLTRIHSYNQQKGAEDMSTNIEALIVLADKESKNVYKELGVELLDDSDFASELAELEAAELKESRKAAARTVVALNNAVVGWSKNKVERIRHLRQEEKRELGSLKRKELLVAYAKETKNYLPLAIFIGHTSVYALSGLGVDQKLWEIPKDWKPSEKALEKAPVEESN